MTANSSGCHQDKGKPSQAMHLINMSTLFKNWVTLCPLPTPPLQIAVSVVFWPWSFSWDHIYQCFMTEDHSVNFIPPFFTFGARSPITWFDVSCSKLSLDAPHPHNPAWGPGFISLICHDGLSQSLSSSTSTHISPSLPDEPGVSSDPCCGFLPDAPACSCPDQLSPFTSLKQPNSSPFHDNRGERHKTRLEAC